MLIAPVVELAGDLVDHPLAVVLAKSGDTLFIGISCTKSSPFGGRAGGKLDCLKRSIIIIMTIRLEDLVPQERTLCADE